MHLDEYQQAASETAIYRDSTGDIRWPRLMYTALGLAGEAGELANQVKKVIRDDGKEVTPDRRSAILDELGDCLWYVAMVAEELDRDLSDVARKNLAKLKERHGGEA